MKIFIIPPHSQAPKNHDYLAETVIDGLLWINTYENNILYTCDYSNGLTSSNSIIPSNIPAALDKCDLIIALWSKRTNPPPQYDLILGNEKLMRKTIFVDGSEYNITGSPKNTNASELDHRFYGHCMGYFKRELKPYHSSDIQSLPFGILSKYVQDMSLKDYLNNNRPIDIFCAYGQTETGLRKESINAVNEVAGELGLKVVTKPVNNDEYFWYLRNSKFAVDAHGGGECNARLYQILINGAVPLMQKYTITMPEKTLGYEWKTIPELKGLFHSNAQLHKLYQSKKKNLDIAPYTSLSRAKTIINYAKTKL